MIRINNKVKLFLLAIAGSVTVATQANARPDVNKTGTSPGQKKTGMLKTTASCKAAEAAIDLDINNVRARLMTGGDMWWDNGTAEARYEIPKGSRKNSLFAGSVWIGGRDEQRNLKVAAQTYRQTGNDYWPGPLDERAEITESDCSEWDRFWKINRETVNKFRALADKSAIVGDTEYETIYQWPAKGNQNALGRNGTPLTQLTTGGTAEYAPFIDVSPAGNPDGIYNPTEGDYPDILGDQFIWWVYNDKGNVKQQSKTDGIGIEVQASAFAFSTKDFMNDATFYNFRVINRGSLSLDSTFIATWTDADLGYYNDDYIGCDTARGLGILYQGTSFDGQGQPNSYGDRVPMVGVDFFKGPMKREMINNELVETELGMSAFTYYNNDNTVIGNPNNGIEIYNYMTGSIRNGQRFSNDFKGPNTPSKAYGDGPLTPFVFYGDPGNRSEWSECTCGNPVGDRRFVHSSGPFRLDPGVINDITIGVVWVADVNGCPNTSFRKIRVADDLAQGLFETDFKTVDGPEAPRMEVRALDRKLVFYLTNDEISNNYREGYGTNLTEEKYRVSSDKSRRYGKGADSLYQFEGYRVFQLKDRFVTPANIFNDAGVVNTDLAIEVFQVDKQNGIKRIINWDKVTDVSDTTYIPVVKIIGADSGIKHSFEITQDAFAQGEEKRLVNYKNYYFVAVAYAYNNFADFNPRGADSTQEIAYLESARGAGGRPIPVVLGVPNPANGDMGTVLNADFGDGVIIKRIEGRGNGSNTLELTEESETEALNGVPVAGGLLHQSLYPNYKAGSGPVKVKVIDPLNIKPHDFEIHINGDISAIDTGAGIIAQSGSWKLVNITTGQTIYNERDLTDKYEQILEEYGISVEIAQAVRPSERQDINNNGLLDSRIIFSDPSNPWLAGVSDQEASSFANWIRAGNSSDQYDTICNFDDRKGDSVGQFYEKTLLQYSTTARTWAPYYFASDVNSARCGFGVAFNPNNIVDLKNLPSVDVVFTSDKSKWTKCVVLEMNDDATLSEGNVRKGSIRSHASWNGDIQNGRPVYSTSQGDTGYSWFPGYAINLETGERLNILFGEDSWLKAHNGDDMIWNPTSTTFELSNPEGAGPFNVIFGGKHTVYIQDTKYDSCRGFVEKAGSISDFVRTTRFNEFAYVGIPLLNPFTNAKFKSLEEGLIPGDVRIQFRIARPYAKYATDINGGSLKNNAYPLYYFSMKDMAPLKLADNANADKDALMDRIHVVPNPYYGYTGYELSRYDTRVKIINLPSKAVVSIYSLDGTLIRRLEKDNVNVSYIDWDIRNAKGLPIAGGMYLVHVNAEGIGDKVIRWFGAMRPIDITNY